jgi:hypothetical protein
MVDSINPVMSPTLESIALKRALEVMTRLVMLYKLNRLAVTEASKQRYQSEARECVLTLEQYSKSTTDTGVRWVVGEARDVLELMKKVA